jgi:hypothetical protein
LHETATRTEVLGDACKLGVQRREILADRLPAVSDYRSAAAEVATSLTERDMDIE